MSRASVFSPASEQAAALSEVSWVLIVGAVLIFVLVMVLLVLGLLRRGRGQVVSSAVWLWGGGVAFPVVVLTALLFYGTLRTAGLDAGVANPDLVVSVTGRLWWWDLRYRDPATGRELRSANELRIPQGRTVQLGLQSDDVVHSFWVPELGGKMDLVPGRVNRLVITATQAGTFRGQCAEFCGEQHARMALHVVVMPPAEFDAWLAARAAAPADAADHPGRQAFNEHGCAVCHAVDGASSATALGPNLAHVSSRSHLGAGVLRNDAGAYKRWLVGVQQLKPGAQMPSYARLDAATLDALSAYLESLR
ncbi:MAG TPA: cytochrome c oxidase subunit II [Rhizobacter sp.]